MLGRLRRARPGAWILLCMALACASDDDSPTDPGDETPPATARVVLRTGLWQLLGGEDFAAGVPVGLATLQFSAQFSVDSLVTATVPAQAGAGTAQAELALPAGRLCAFRIAALGPADEPVYRSLRFRIAAPGDTLTLDMADTADATAPQLTGALEIAPLGSGELALSWPMASEGGQPAPGAAYLIHVDGRGRPAVETFPFAAVEPGATSALLTGLGAGGDFTLSVAAFDAAGNTGNALTGQVSLPPAGSGLYVDVATGEDAPGHGGPSLPFKTISYALAQARADQAVYIAAGDYGEASGESFPLVMPPGTRLFGTVNFAVGRPQTTIVAPAGEAAIVVTDTGVIRGIEILCPPTGLLRAIDARTADLWASWLRIDAQGGATANGINLGAYARIHDSVFKDFSGGRALGLFGDQSGIISSCRFLSCQSAVGVSGHDKAVLSCLFDGCTFGIGASGSVEGDTGDLYFCGNLLRDGYLGIGLAGVSGATLLANVIWQHAFAGIELALCFDGILVDGCHVDGGSTGIYVSGCSPTIGHSNLVCNRVNLFVQGDGLVDARENRWDQSPPLVTVRPGGPCEDCDICYDGDASGTPEPLWDPDRGTSDCLSFTVGPMPTRELPAALEALRRRLGLR